MIKSVKEVRETFKRIIGTFPVMTTKKQQKNTTLFLEYISTG